MRDDPPQSDFATALISLGANLGDREAALEHAVEMLRATQGVELTAISRWYPTRPIGGPADQPEFLNGAARLVTSLSAKSLHARLKEIERSVGRTERERWAAREIDLDLLLHGAACVTTPSLVVPHPRMVVRRFVLEPAAEIAADVVHPEIGWTVGRLFEHLRMALPHLALIGGTPSDRAWLVDRLVASGMCLPWRGSTSSTPDPSRTWWVSASWDADSQALPCDPKLRIFVTHSALGSTSDPRVYPQRGPILKVDMSDAQAAVAEITAALQSMR